MTISEIIFFVLFVVVIISYFVSNHNGNKYLKEERDKEIEFRAAVLNRMNRIGYYLVVVYWCDTKNFSCYYTYAKDRDEAYKLCVRDYSSEKQLNIKFAIVSIQFLGGE